MTMPVIDEIAALEHAPPGLMELLWADRLGGEGHWA